MPENLNRPWSCVGRSWFRTGVRHFAQVEDRGPTMCWRIVGRTAHGECLLRGVEDGGPITHLRNELGLRATPKARE